MIENYHYYLNNSSRCWDNDCSYATEGSRCNSMDIQWIGMAQEKAYHGGGVMCQQP